jgi:hypothetical protein
MVWITGLGWNISFWRWKLGLWWLWRFLSDDGGGFSGVKIKVVLDVYI